MAGRPSAQLRPVDLLVEAHEDGLALPDRGSSEISRRSEHRIDDVLPPLPAGLDPADSLALRDDHCPGLSHKLSRILASQLATRQNDFCRLDFIGIQELGCSNAGRSALAGVVPVDLSRHCLSYPPGCPLLSSPALSCPLPPSHTGAVGALARCDRTIRIFRLSARRVKGPRRDVRVRRRAGIRRARDYQSSVPGSPFHGPTSSGVIQPP